MIATGMQVAVRTGVGSREHRSRFGRLTGVLAVAALSCGLLGCSQKRESSGLQVVSLLPYGTTIAVAPALNFSGSSAFDPVVVGDYMASELSTIEGVRVVGVTRVMSILADQGVTQIQSPEHAVQVCERIGADAILVFAITEYDPYRPIVGIAAQIYGRPAAPRTLDPVATSRMARPFPVPDRTDAVLPWGEVQKTFNGVHEDIQMQVRDYADDRNESDTPYGWRKYLVSQEWYLRFCCFAVARELVSQPPPVPQVASRGEWQEFGP